MQFTKSSIPGEMHLCASTSAKTFVALLAFHLCSFAHARDLPSIGLLLEVRDDAPALLAPPHV